MNDVTRLTNGKLLPAQFNNVLHRLADMFGSRLRILSLDRDRVTFQVASLTDECLIRRLQDEQAKIFDAQPWYGSHCLLGPPNFQITRALESRSGPGVSILYLGAWQKREEYIAGFWYV